MTTRTRTTLLAAPALAAALLLAIITALPAAAEAAGARLFFLHHSSGRNIIYDGDARLHLESLNQAKGAAYVLWDHDYNYIGLSDTDGDKEGYSFQVPDDNTDPDGLHKLWTTDNAARDSILARFDVIAFKSCYAPTNELASDAQLEQYKTWFREIRDVLAQHPDKTFLVLSSPPLMPLATNVEEADRARAYARWLGSEDFRGGHANIRFFDLFDLLAHPDDGSAERNMLRAEYVRSPSVPDSHPNDLANQTVAPLLVDALVAAAERATVAAVELPAPLRLLGNRPNPFNPSTAIVFALDRAADVAVDVFDVQGRRVRTLLTAPLAAGDHEVRWDGRDGQGRAAPSGVYLYHVRAGDHVLQGRMVLAK